MVSDFPWHSGNVVGTDAAVAVILVIELHTAVHIRLALVVKSLLELFRCPSDIPEMGKENLFLFGELLDYLLYMGAFRADGTLAKGDAIVGAWVKGSNFF